MYILTPENKSMDTALIPEATDALYYCILDHTDNDDVDYRFPPMVFLEEFPRASIELKIGKHVIRVPLSWSMLLGDEDCHDLEIMPLLSFNGRDFKAFIFNPRAGFMPSYVPVEIINIYQEVKWSIPSIQPTHMLCVPLCGGDNPPCGFFSESKNKLPEIVDISDVF